MNNMVQDIPVLGVGTIHQVTSEPVLSSYILLPVSIDYFVAFKNVGY
jgi:hypothetical protein